MRRSARELAVRGGTHGARRQLAQRDRPEAQPDERDDGVLDHLEHPAHLPVAAFVQCDVDERNVTPDGDDAQLRGRCAAFLEPHAPENLLHRGGLEPPAQRRAVRLLDAEARMREDVRRVAVISEQQHAARVVVEPADRDDARGDSGAPHDVGDGTAAFGIAHRRHHADRFVQHDVRARRRRTDDAAVDFDARVVVDARSELAHDAPRDAHAPRDDQLLRAAARRDPGRREKFLKPQDRPGPRPF